MARRHLVRTATHLNRQSPWAGKLPPLFYFTDPDRRPDPLSDIAGLPPDTGVIFRHYDAADRHHLAGSIAQLCRAQDRLCLIAGDAGLAARVSADGVHWPENQFAFALAARLRTPPHWMVTTSVHSLTAILRLRGRRVTAAFLSPIFETQSHPDITGGLGPLRARALIRRSNVPIYLLGGITQQTAPRMVHSGAVGFGVIGGLISD